MAEYPALTDDNQYNFNSSSERPWADHLTEIQNVKFGSPVSPVSLAYWFQDCANLNSINWANCDTSAIESLRAAFSKCGLTEIKLPAMPAVTNLRFAFAENENVTSVDLSELNATGVTDMNGTFKSCYNLLTVDLTGVEGSIDNCSNMISNASASAPNMKVTTIHAVPGLDFSGATNASNVFRGCVDLVGGAGTVYDPDNVGNQYAHIDGGASNPGYFTGAGVRT